MRHTVLVRYDEIALKKQPVRGRFEKILFQNIGQLMRGLSPKIRRERGRIIIETDQPEEFAGRVSRVPGIASSSPAFVTSASLEDIQSLAVSVARDSFKRKGTFAVRSRRTGSHDFTSREISEAVGANILEVIPNLSVDLDNPDQELFVEVRGDEAYVFTKKFEGIGGLPVGSQEDAVTIFQGDQSSLMATLLMLKRGSLVHPIFFDLESERENNVKNQVLDVAKQLADFHSGLKLRVVPFSHVTSKISEEAPEHLAGIINWRAILRFSESTARELGAKAIVTGGESIRNSNWLLTVLRMIEESIATPVLRPLIGFEDEEISEITKKMGKFDFPEDFHPPYPEIVPHDLGGVTGRELGEVEDSLSLDSLLERASRDMETYELG